MTEVQNKFRWTALHAASFWGWDETIQLLLAKRAQIEAQDENGLTPLLAATQMVKQ